MPTRDFDRTTLTNERGEFRFENVEQGTYELQVSLEGFSTLAIPVTVGSIALKPLRLVLQIGGVQETVTVSADSPLLQTSTRAIQGGPGIQALSGRGRTPEFNTEAYDRIDENRFRRVTDDPLSTFSIDVDTASYSNVRRFLNQGTLPPADAVRVEELINYFRFAYRIPRTVHRSRSRPRSPRVPGIRDIASRSSGCRPAGDGESTPPRNLVFLLDVSGSMTPPDKLPLVKTAMRMLADTLTAADRVAIVVYAGASGLVLPSTPGDRKAGHPARHRRPPARGLDERRGGHPARLRHRQRALHQGRHQPRHPGDRRRLQRRRHEPGRARPA